MGGSRITLRRLLSLLALCLLATSLTQPDEVWAESNSPAGNQEVPIQSPPQIDAEVEQLMNDQAITLGSYWAGWSLEPDGTVLVGLTESVIPPVLANHPRIRVVTRRFSQSRLDGAVETVTARLNPLLAPGVEPGTPGQWPYEAYLDTRGNVVEVEVDRRHESKRQLIEVTLADELSAGTIRVTYKDDVGGANPQSCTSRDSCFDPFRGGTRLNSSTGFSCTLGFVMRQPGTGIRFHSSASHCPGSPWTHAGIPIGPTTWTQDSGNHDFKVIRQNNETQPAPSNWVLRNNLTTTAITSKMSAPGGLGVTVCREGFVSGEQCGQVNSTNATWSGRSGFGRMSAPDILSCRGDSGGPVFNAATNRAYGIHAGIDDAQLDCGPTGTNLYFTWISNAEAASGYQVLLTSTSEGLGPGQRMPCGYALVSPNGAYNLQLQCGDGHLVMRDSAGNAIWATNVYGPGNANAFLVMQNDGHLVEYRPNGSVVWDRPTSGWVGGSRLVLQDDKNLVVYTPTGGVTWHRFCNC
jgi:hypothetical protein